MLLGEKMAQGGDFLFRWRSYILLAFAPLLLMTFSEGEAVEKLLGEPVEDVYDMLCIAMVVSGLVVRAVTVGFVPAGTSGRNTTGQIASQLNVTGIYSVTRNPLYLGNCITYLGIFLYAQNFYLAFALTLFLVIYYERIILAEEAFLAERFGDEYMRWAKDVPVFWPRFSGWTRPALPFSLRSVLRREYSGWFAAVLCLYIIETGLEVVGEGEGWFEPGWLVALGVAAAAYLLLRTAKKKTSLLDVDGR
ncbi:MAG: isoprenylcysteine carboxylmethyltransferase family protein [Rhizobiaceae bacterium]